MTEHRQHNIHIQIEQMTISNVRIDQICIRSKSHCIDSNPNSSWYAHLCVLFVHAVMISCLRHSHSIRFCFLSHHTCSAANTHSSVQSIYLPVSHTHTVAHIIQRWRTVEYSTLSKMITGLQPFQPDDAKYTHYGRQLHD